MGVVKNVFRPVQYGIYADREKTQLPSFKVGNEAAPNGKKQANYHSFLIVINYSATGALKHASRQLISLLYNYVDFIYINSSI